MNAKSFNLSVQGASHIKKNKECQDNSASYYDENCAVAIVCDGHGGDDYMRSAVGSYHACKVAEMDIRSFLGTVSKEQFFANPEKNLRNLKASIINGWNNAIFSHYESHPFTKEELSGISERAKRKYLQEGRIESAYGTTIIAVAMTKEYWFGIHIGDGKCVAVNPEGKFVQPIPWDPKCFLNATTSICDSNALEHFRHFYSEKLPVAVFVGSDGIDDCFSNNDQLHNLYKTILYSFGTTDFDEAIDGLKDYLPRLSAKGSGDDVSISAMFDIDLLPELDVVKEFDREKEKARVEENARKAAEKNEEERKRIEEEHIRFLEHQKRTAQKAGRCEKEPSFCTEYGAKLIEKTKFCGNRDHQILMIPTKQPEPESEIKVISVKPCEGNQPDDGKQKLEEYFNVSKISSEQEALAEKAEIADASSTDKTETTEISVDTDNSVLEQEASPGDIEPMDSLCDGQLEQVDSQEVQIDQGEDISDAGVESEIEESFMENEISDTTQNTDI